MKYVNVPVSDDFHKRLKVVCALQEEKITDVVRRLLEEYVEKAEKKLNK